MDYLQWKNITRGITISWQSFNHVHDEKEAPLGDESEQRVDSCPWQVAKMTPSRLVTATL